MPKPTRFRKRRDSERKRRAHRHRRLHTEQLEDRILLAVQDLSSFPAEFTQLGGDVLFSAQDSAGYELWKYDGISVTQVADINPTGSSSPSELLAVGNRLYFIATDGSDNSGLWTYDGGTVSQLAATVGLGPLDPSELTAVGSQLFFVADDNVNGRELWKSDGTNAGTEMVLDVFPTEANFEGPIELTAFNGKLYFSAYDDSHGWELWESDGTDVGTQLVVDIRVGVDGAMPQELTVSDGALYFRADDGVNGEELWRYDGVNAPALVKDIDGLGTSNVRNLTDVGGQLFFSTKDVDADTVSVWVTDGTELGTQLVQQVRAGEDWDTAAFVAQGGDLLFSAIGPDERQGWELWTVDSGTLTPTLLRTFDPWGQWSDPWSLTVSGSKTYFASYDLDFGHELWVTDGTPSGTDRLTDINFQVRDATPQFLTDIGGVLYFAANNGVSGIEPYNYDPSGLGLQTLGNVTGATTDPQVFITLQFESDTGYDNTDGITRNTRPYFVVDVNQPGQVEIDFDGNGSFEFSRTVTEFGTYQYQPATPLLDGDYVVTSRFTANSLTDEDTVEVTIDTVGPTLLGTYPVADATFDFQTLYFSEEINEERLFKDDFQLSGTGISGAISLDEFYISDVSDEIDLAFDPLATAGAYSISVNPGVEDLAGNLLNPASPTTADFELLSDPVFLTDDTQVLLWDVAYEGKDLVLDGVTLEVSGTHSVASLWMINGATLQPVEGQELDLTVVGDVFVEDDSTINADARGDAGGALASSGFGTGAGAAGTDGGGGGAHGGDGGTGGSTADAAAGLAHGTADMPVTLGSGGGGSTNSTGGAGGGAVKLTVSGQLLLDGAITANGNQGTGENASGGAGGAIWLVVDSLVGTGVISSMGGGALGFGGAGGGGRIAVDVTTNEFAGVVVVTGGLGGDLAQNGADGTVDADQAFPAAVGGELIAEAKKANGKNIKKKGKKGGYKNKVKQSPSDKGNDLKKKAKSVRDQINKKNSITGKKLKPGSYSNNYKVQINKKKPSVHKTVNNTIKFTPPSRSGFSLTRRLQFAVAAQPEFAPSTSWDGGGDGVSWTDPLNWSSDVLPGLGDDVFIDGAVVDQVTLTGTHQVNSVFSSAGFVIDGHLTVFSSSTVTGSFLLQANRSITTEGPEASFTTMGAVDIDGGDLFATKGGTITLNNLVNYRNPTDVSMLWRAQDAGSLISAPDLVHLFTGRDSSGFGGSQADIDLRALEGGIIDLPSVVQLGDPDDTAVTDNDTAVIADGVGSRILLPALTHVLDRGTSQLSLLEATNGGELHAPLLSSLRATHLRIDGTAVPIATSQIIDLTFGAVTLSGTPSGPGIVDHDFSSLESAEGSTFDITGVLPDFFNLSNIASTNITLRQGVELTLPSVLFVEGRTDDPFTWRVEDAGSRLHVPNATRILTGRDSSGTGGSHADIDIQAYEGGVIELPSVVLIGDPEGVGVTDNDTAIVADGVGSRILLPALTQLMDRSSSQRSLIETLNGGEILVPLLSTARSTHLRSDGTGVPISTSQITAMAFGAITLAGVPSGNGSIDYDFSSLETVEGGDIDISGVLPDFASLSNIASTNITLRQGVDLTLPSVLFVEGRTDDPFTWRVEDAGSRLTVPNATRILTGRDSSGIGGAHADIDIQAYEGGVIDLPSVVQIGDPDGTGVTDNDTDLIADGVGSRILLHSLNEVIDRSSRQLSRLEALNGGRVELPETAPVVLSNTNLAVGSNGVIRVQANLQYSGDLSGDGTLEGSISNPRTLYTQGELTITGDLVVGPASSIEAEVTGPLPEDIERIEVGGQVTLGGELALTTAGGYEPPFGAVYRVIDASNRRGTFEVISGLEIDAFKRLAPIYDPGGLSLFATAQVSTGVFESNGQSLGSSPSSDVAIGDVDNDGDLDAFVANGNSLADQLWLNDGAAQFSLSTQMLSAASSTGVALGDVDNDGDLDAYVTSPTGDTVWLNQGGIQGGAAGDFANSTLLLVGGTREDVALEDINDDGFLDAVIAVSDGGNRVLLNQGRSGSTWNGFVDSGQVLGSFSSKKVVLADLDGDGDLDIAVANDQGNANRVWFNQGGDQAGVEGQFVDSGQSLGNATFSSIAVGDLEADGDLDLLVLGADAQIWRNNGAGQFSAFGSPIPIPDLASGGDVKLADLDADGDLDAFVVTTASAPGASTVWFNNGQGVFQDGLQRLGDDAATSVVLGDLDQDGDIDAFQTVSAVAGADPLNGNHVWINVEALDFGDAPEPTYQTTRLAGGAAHIIRPGVHLGASVDSDADGSPNPFALGDDNNGDDEDGVAFADTLFVGVANSLAVEASVNGFLDGWIDYNNDGDWDDTGEQPFVSVPLAAGPNSIDFMVPSGATATFATFARFRFSTTGGLAADGIAFDGEVEDYFVPIRELDLGDAPVALGTLLQDDGARHMLVDGFYLGSGVDAEPEGQPDGNALSDTDDGVTMLTPLTPGQAASLEITASAPGFLDAWIDYNGNGDWTDPGERVALSVLLNAGANQLNFAVAGSTSVGDEVFARFRFSSTGALAPTGFAPNGEVEDYKLAITNGLIGDGNNDGSVDAADYAVWRNSRGSQVTPYTRGDYDGNGVVDADDYLDWRAGYGSQLSPAAAAGTESPVATAMIRGASGSVNAVVVPTESTSAEIASDYAFAVLFDDAPPREPALTKAPLPLKRVFSEDNGNLLLLAAQLSPTSVHRKDATLDETPHSIESGYGPDEEPDAEGLLSSEESGHFHRA